MSEIKRWLANAQKKNVTVEVNGAVRFEDDLVFALLEAVDKDDDRSTALVRLTLTADAVDAEVMAILGGVLAWRAESPSDHIFVLSGGRISRLQGDAFTVLADIEDGFIEDMVRVDPETLAFVGSEGMMQTLRDGVLTALESTTEEDLRVVTHHNGALIAGGSYATLVHQQVDGSFEESSPLDTDQRPGVSALRVLSDGLLRVGFNDGRACVLDGDRVTWLAVEREEGFRATVFAVAEYEGAELWGDDQFGLLRRVGDRLEPVAGISHSFGLHVDGPRLTIDSGKSIVLFDGGLGGRCRRIDVTPRHQALVQLARQADSVPR